MVYQQFRDLRYSRSFSVGGTSTQQSLPPGLPNWESLFGSLDTCECQHCRSVYSPAAYFVDLLHVLLGQKGGAARKELFRRRPDLKYTKLTCEHTETLIPYIDLVNEVLETYAAQDDLGNSKADDHAKDSTNDTSDFSAEDLSANPQHPNPKSKDDAERSADLVRSAVYPLTLPFDMNLEMARQFLQEQGSNRFEVMNTFKSSDELTLAAERLGLSTRQWEIVTLKQMDGTSNARTPEDDRDLNVMDLWGNPLIPAGSSLGKELSRVRTFLDAAGIQYKELIELLHTRVLNPNFPINLHVQNLSASDRTTWLSAHPTENQLALTVIELGGDPSAPCDLTKTVIAHLDGSPLNDEELSKFNRFIRLWKILGCTVHELDDVLTSLGGTDITPDVIRGLSVVWQVQMEFDLPYEHVSVLIGQIPTAGTNSLYARLFLNKAILQIDDKLALEVNQNELEHSGELLSSHIPAILAAFQIGEDQFNQLGTYLNLDLAVEPLSLKTLSSIYRYVILAKGLKIRLHDLIIWLNLLKQPPLATLSDLTKTKTILKKAVRLGVKAADLAYVFEDTVVAGGLLPTPDDVIAQCTKTMREGLQKITQENTPFNGVVTVEFLTNRLGTLLDTEEISKIISILNGTNSAVPFSYLLSLKVPDRYKPVLADYLKDPDITDISATSDVADRLGKYWLKVQSKLLPVLRKTFIQQHLTATFKLDASLTGYFLSDATVLQICLDTEVETAAHNKGFADLYLSLYKCSWLVGKVQLTAEELSFFQNNPNFNNFSWKSFDIVAWLRLADYVNLRGSLPTLKKDLLSIFSAAKSGGDIVQAITDVTAWDKANVRYFVSKLAPMDFFDEIALVELNEKNALSQKIGVSIAKLESWAGSTIDTGTAQDIKRSVKTKYDESAWTEVSTRVHNRLRNHWRDALVAFLLQKPEIKALDMKNSDDLYDYFLIDVDMNACMKTSRLVQAIAAVQLFVQKIQLNLLAPKLVPSEIDAEQWEWMKNYRVWEAARKVFLYPENWIEPELRDDKSPFFRELESELLQSEVTNDSAEKALMNYLEKLHDVSRLDICGMYEDTETEELHVFGRTFNSPSVYYYRKLDLNAQVWTPWEKVPLDIQGNEEGESAGVHLIPVVWNRRLYLFWPIFTEKQDKDKVEQEKQEQKKRDKEREDWDIEHFPMAQDKAKKRREIEDGRKRTLGLFGGKYKTENYFIDPLFGDNKNYVRSDSDVNELYNSLLAKLPEIPPKPEPYEINSKWAYYEVKLAWGEYRNQKWSTKKVSQSFIRTGSNRYGATGIHIYRFTVTRGRDLSLRMLFTRFREIPVGEFHLSCNSRVTVPDRESPPFRIEVISPRQVNFYQSHLSANYSGRQIYWHEQDSFPLTLMSRKGEKKDMLAGSDQEYKVVFPPDHNFSDNTDSPFFYQDKSRTYFVDCKGQRFPMHDSGIVDLSQIKIPFTGSNRPAREGSARLADVSTHVSRVPAKVVRDMTANGQLSSSTSSHIQSIHSLSNSDVSAPSPRFLQHTCIDAVTKLSSSFKVPHAFQFLPFFQAYVCDFIDALNREGIDGLLNLYNQQRVDIFPTFSPGGVVVEGIPIPSGISTTFVEVYRPNRGIVEEPFPLEAVDFSPSGAYSLYNWELFFHIPMLVANRLSKNHRYEEAMRWYHFVYFPMTNDNLNSEARFWQVLPFRNTPKETLDSLLDQLQKPANDPRRQELETAIAAWRENPFNPHLIARMRLIAYKKNVVLKYLDNLIAWADSLFNQDTMESINEATQLYVLAAKLLGRAPEQIPPRGKIQAYTYAELEANGLDAFSNALVNFETLFPFYNLQPISQGHSGSAAILNSTAKSLYFCLPDNSKLVRYWDTVSDRLFKIRHCQNIEGVERQLTLFQPAIDPALLVKAVAGGVDISSVLADLNAPLPYYRFAYMLPKALEMCGELKSIGANLLSALEKMNGEELALMRAQQETLLLNLARLVRQLQVTEAQRNREGLEKTREITQARYDYYVELMKGGLSSSEKEHQILGLASLAMSLIGQQLEMAASSAHPAPDTYIGAMFALSGGPIALQNMGGGSKSASSLSAVGRAFNMLSTMTRFGADFSQTNAGYERRAAEWKYQRDVATKELSQIDRQILASQIREQIADQELTNHEQQIDNARKVEEFYRNKFSQEELYGWMVGQLSTIYFQCYQLAYDLAKKAEKAYRYELGMPTSNFVQFGIWDSFRKGLLSGEQLYLSLKQMDKSYMDLNKREFELSKSISLLFCNPAALIALKETGRCEVDLPESLFDMDYPGHYMRRIKNVSVTIPCVVGPHASVNCTLTLLKSRTRVKNVPTAPYAENSEGDDRFEKNFGALQSIATSSAQNDTGLFELSFRDERYLPFEGAGVISTWALELSQKFPQFDHQTISDVILRINYTARPGGKSLQKEAEESLKKLLKDESGMAQSRLFSLRHEFPTEWNKLLSVADKEGDHQQTFIIDKQRFPFVFHGATIIAKKIELFGMPKVISETPVLEKLTLSSPSGPVSLLDGSRIGNLVPKTSSVDIEVKELGLNRNEVEWVIKVKKEDVDVCLRRIHDIFILIEYVVDL